MVYGICMYVCTYQHCIELTYVVFLSSLFGRICWKLIGSVTCCFIHWLKHVETTEASYIEGRRPLSAPATPAPAVWLLDHWPIDPLADGDVWETFPKYRWNTFSQNRLWFHGGKLVNNFDAMQIDVCFGLKQQFRVRTWFKRLSASCSRWERASWNRGWRPRAGLRGSLERLQKGQELQRLRWIIIYPLVN